MNPKNSRKKSPIHENADANITCDFGDGDISRSRSFLSNTCDTYIHTHIASSIIGRCSTHTCMYTMYTSHNTKLGLVIVLKFVYGSQLAQPRCHFNMAIAMFFCLRYIIMIFKMARIVQRCISSADVQNGEYLRRSVGRK